MKQIIILFLLLPCICFSAKKFEVKEKYHFFADLTYLDQVNKSKDSEKFQTTSVPYIKIPFYLSWYAYYNNIDYSDISKGSPEEIREALIQITPTYTDENEKLQLIDNAMRVVEFTQLETDKEIMSYLKSEMSKRSFGDKTVFLSNILSMLSDNYDHEMLEDDYDERPVSDQDMIRAIRNSIETGKKVPAGVCRHMHQFAIRVAKGMGIQNVFSVGYRTQKGGHRTLILGIPGSPSQVVQMNYGQKITMDKVSGSMALNQDHSIPMTGIRFRVYNGDDQTSIILPSEEGALLNRLTGGKDSDLAQGFRVDSSIQQLGIKTPYGTFRVFKANSKNKNYSSFKGIGYNKTFKFFNYFSNEIGIGGFESQRRLNNDDKIASKGIYARNNLGFNWKFYTGKKLSVRLFSNLYLRGSYYCTRYKLGDCVVNYDMNADAQTGIGTEYRTDKVTFGTSLSMMTQAAPNHASFTSGHQLIVPAITAKGSLKVSLSEDYTSNHEVAITRYNLGTNIYNVFSTTNSLNSEELELDLYHLYKAPLNNDTPIWLPGAVEQSIYGAKKTFLSKKLEINASYEVNKNDLEQFFGVNLKVFY